MKRSADDLERYGIKKDKENGKVVLISYDSLVTGSWELRNDNKNSYNYLYPAYSAAAGGPAVGAGVPGFRTLGPQNMTWLGKYSIEYDNPGGANKIAEPHYDSFLVGISKLNNATFDANFHYLRTDMNDVPMPVFPPGVPVPYVGSGLRTDVMLDDMGVPVTSNRETIGFDYNTAIHIYLMGPASPRCAGRIQTLIDNARGRTVVIHVQGEANATAPLLQTTTHTAPMFTAKPGLFPVSFNLWSGEREMQRIRGMVTESYTVGVLYNEAEAGAQRVLGDAAAGIQSQQVSRGLTNARPHPAGIVVGGPIPANLSYIPQIYDDIISYLEECILTTTTPCANHNLFGRLLNFNTELVCQDTYDKDNLPAVAFILSVNQGMTNIEVISRRIYDSTPIQGGPGPRMIIPAPPHAPARAAIVAALTAQGRPAPENFVPNTDDTEWAGMMYSINPLLTGGANPPFGGVPPGFGLADVIRNTGLNLQLTQHVRTTIRDRVEVLLNAVVPGLLQAPGAAAAPNFNVYPAQANSTTDGEGPVSLSRRAPFCQQIFKNLHPGIFWGVSNPNPGGPNPSITPRPPAGVAASPAWQWPAFPGAGFPPGAVAVNAVGGRKSKRNRKQKRKSRKMRR
jgi:hypothetical protein